MSAQPTPVVAALLLREECVILDIPQGLRLNLLGLIVQIDQIRIVADRAGMLGGLLASLTCGGIEAERLEALAQTSVVSFPR
jgi:hypothetical protein